MANLKKVRIMERVGNPSSGVILQPGTVVELNETWADRYIAQGKAELVVEKPKTSESSQKKRK
jgi:hypothetical protein